jgi:hypothetical protein
VLAETLGRDLMTHRAGHAVRRERVLRRRGDETREDLALAGAAASVRAIGMWHVEHLSSIAACAVG